MKKLIAILLLLPASAWSLTIDVYHTSDVHGWYYSRPAKWSKENPDRLTGGFAALKAMVEDGTNPYILLDSGDTFQGTPEGTLTKGMATVKMMNMLGYSAATVGNHDYDYTEASFKEMVRESDFHWLGANVYEKKTARPTEYLRPYTIVRKAGKRIAVLGIAGEHTVASTLPLNVAHLEFRNEADEARRWTEIIRKEEKPDAIIIIAHVGIGPGVPGPANLTGWEPTDKQAASGTLAIARASKADVVLGGHHHASLPKGYRDPVSGSLLGESYWGLTSVSRVALDFDDKTGKLKDTSVELIPIWVDETGEDQLVIDKLKVFSARVDKEMNKQLGVSAYDLDKAPDGMDSDIGNWFTDAMRRHSGADIAFQNTSGIRSVLKRGKVMVRDIFQIMPFENTLVKLTLTGEQIRRLMADNFRNCFSKMQVSGLKVLVKKPCDDPAGISLERNGKPVGDKEKFTVVTNNYLTTGGHGGQVFSEAPDLDDTMIPIRNLLLEDMQSNPVKVLPEGGRIVRAD